MAEIIVSAENLTKHYRKINALNNFHMEVHRGDVYGFVGKNGAGKTTLLRILTGRSRQTSGKIELFGKSDRNDLDIQRGRIGSIIETPAFYPGMTAKDNLEVLRLQMDISGKGCISDALKMVGLEEVSSKKVKDFSLGMKQRLGLAMALFGNRELLVLDEPVNGLDPEGIVGFREILKKLNVEFGVTILISSHFLDELSRIATHYGFLDGGRMVKEISAKELESVCQKCVRLKVNDTKILARILDQKHITYKILSDTTADIFDNISVSELVLELAEENCTIISMLERGESLESYYLNLLGGEYHA